MKHFRLNGALVETRLFMRHPDGDWAGYTYEWNAQRTDATLVQGGKTVAIGAQSWIFPSGNDCLTCHTAAAGFALGLEAAQLNRNFTVREHGAHGEPAAHARRDHDVHDAARRSGAAAVDAGPVRHRGAARAARAGLSAHELRAAATAPSGPTPSSMDLRYSTLLSSTNACGAPPQSGDLGIGAAARIIAPGSAANSVLVARMNRRDANGMPPLASNVVDAAGVALLQQWIASLTTCQ